MPPCRIAPKLTKAGPHGADYDADCVRRRTYRHTCVSRSMRRFYGISPREYILTLKLKNAAQELIGTDHSVTAIAYACGFNNLAYFHTAFSARYHTTPGKYRKTYGK